MSAERVVVTGGAGFIGSHLVERLLEEGYRVRVFDDFSSGTRENLQSSLRSIELCEGDIRDIDACRRAMKGSEFVLHHAARASVPASIDDPTTTMAVNVAGTANVFLAARDAKVRRVVYASSSAIYGNAPNLPSREQDVGVLSSPYALSKHTNEELANLFAELYEMDFVGLRYFNVYGPRQDPAATYAAVVARTLAACRAGETPVVHGDGEQSRDFVFVRDVAYANLLALQGTWTGGSRIYNIGSGQGTTINQLVATIQQETGSSCRVAHTNARQGDIRESVADCSRAQSELGWQARRWVPTGEW